MSTHRENVLKKLGLPLNTHLSLSELAKKTGVPYVALRESYNRGVGAWKNNISSVRLKKDFSKNPNTTAYPRSARLPKEMWAMARVYSLLDKGTDYFTADKDLITKYASSNHWFSR